MSINRFNARRDKNEPEIIAALEKCGAQVKPLSDSGVPDLLVSFRGKNLLIECKMPKVGKLTPAQQIFHREWPTHVYIVESTEQAVDVLNSVGRIDAEPTPEAVTYWDKQGRGD